MELQGLIRYGEKVKLDAKDKKIVRILEENARATIADISRKTGIQRDSVLYRINRMQQQNVIRFFRTVLNPSLLGYDIYAVANYTLQNRTHEKEQAFIHHLQMQPNVVYIAKVSGQWDFIVNIAAKNMLEFDNILSEIRIRFSDIIKDSQISSIIQEYKYDKMVDLINL